MPIIDLTGTKWQLKSSVYIETQVSYAVNCSYDGYTFESIDFIYYTADGKTWKALKLDGAYAIVNETASPNPVDVYNPSIIEITGGTDATDSSLIAWLEANATLQEEPVADNKISIGNLPIEKVFIGNTEVSKLTLGNVEIYSKGQPTPSGYQVTVSYAGPYSATIYDGEDATGTELAQLYSGEDTKTVTCTTGKIYADVVGGIRSITGSNGATSSNPSTITANNASIDIFGDSGGG